jgi:FOG: GGDEF domain
MRFVRVQILFILLLSVPAFALDEALLDSMKLVEQLNRQNQLPRCETDEACSPFMSELTRSDEKKHLGVMPSQLNACESLIQDKVFGVASDLSNYYGEKVFPRLGGYITSQIKRCSRNLDQARAKRQTSLQYYNFSRLEMGQTATLNEIAEIENILGTDSKKYLSDKGFDCSNSAYQSVVERCENLKNRCQPQARMDEIIQTTRQTLENIANAETLIKQLTQQLLDMGLRARRTSQEGQELESKVAQLKNLILLEKQTHPWITGDAFQKYQNKDLKKAITEQLKETKVSLQEKFNKINQNTACLTRASAKCNTSDFREFVDQMPDVGDVVATKTGFRRKNISAGSYMEYERCLHNAKVDQIKTADKVISQAGTVVAVGVTLIAPGPWALLIDTAWLGVAGTEAYKACVGSAELEANKQAHADNSCPTSGIKNPSHAVAIHGDCLTASGYAALGALPVAGAVAKISRGAEATAAVGNLERRTEDTVTALRGSSEKRSAATRVISGPDGVITKTAKLKTVNNVPDSIKIVEVKNSENKNVLYFQSREKLTDGTYVKSSREVQLDPLTGAIDANYPAGRELFEKMAQAKAGESYVAFVDVGSLGAVNKTFAGGSAAGDRYIKAVAEKIMAHSDGKITLARLGGDEFGLIIDEADPKKVKAILEAIQKDLRLDLKGEGKLVFREEKIKRAEDYRQNPSVENRERIDELAKVQQPDISIGSSQVGRDDDLEVLLNRSEDQAKEMKIATALRFGRSAEKYGSTATPSSRPRPLYRAEIKEPATSSSWKKASTETKSPSLDSLRDVKLTRKEEVTRFKGTTVARYEDELGNESYRIEKYGRDEKGDLKQVSYEIPVRGNTGMLDGSHPESRQLVMEHFNADKASVLVMPKLKNLKYINYFQDGSKAGDKILEAVSQSIKKQMRESDLSFKLGGADFLMSLKGVDPEKLKVIEDRISKEVARSPAVKQVVSAETQALAKKRDEAIQNGDLQLAKVLQQKVQEMANFKPDIRFQSVGSGDVSGKMNYDDAIKILEGKFPKD